MSISQGPHLRNVAKNWCLVPHDRDAIERLATALNVPPIVAQVLLNRGLSNPNDARHFLDAPLTDLYPPAQLPGAIEAAERLFNAVQQGKRIWVYGDYDVDGITGTAILWQALQLLGAAVDFYVPHRLEEGYGLNEEALQQIAQSGGSLVITVDCGITALTQAAEARRLGLELIITDHHEPRSELPDAAVIVHPRIPAGTYPFGELSGAGVAFKVAWALCQRACGSEKVTPRFREFLLDGVALAALGLVADVVPLRGENRLFVRHGLARLKHRPTIGLKALLEATSLADKPMIRADDVAFKLAPRLNAAGRLGCARLVVDLLTTNSAQRAGELVRVLEDQNTRRQQLERRTATQARELVAQGQEEARALVLASEEWHPGVVGIVAGRIAEQFARPTFLIALAKYGKAISETDTENEVLGHGSGRSIPGFALHEALQECSALLLSHGGHAMAAGLKIRPERVDEFRELFCTVANRRFPTGMPLSRLIIDAEVPLNALTIRAVKDLDRLEPYGSENKRPLFLAGGLQIIGEPAKLGGGERHLGFRVRQQDTTLRAIAFGMGERLEALKSQGGQCCLVFTPRINEWQGFRRVELEVLDFQPGPIAQLE